MLLLVRVCVCVHAELCVPSHSLAPQNLDGPLRVKAEEIFEAKMKECQQSLQQDSVQNNAVKEYSGKAEAEDEHKERDRMCDTVDNIFNDEETEDLQIPIEETALEMDGKCIEFKIAILLLFEMAHITYNVMKFVWPTLLQMSLKNRSKKVP